MEITGYQISIFVMGVFDFLGLKSIEFQPGNEPAIFWGGKGRTFLQFLHLFFAVVGWLTIILAFVFMPWYQALLLLFLGNVGAVLIRTLLKFKPNALIAFLSVMVCVFCIGYIVLKWFSGL